jgi:sugar phosphate permease
MRLPFGWQIVLAVVVGSAFSPATVINVPFSLFIPQIQRTYGWTGPEISTCLSVFLAALVISLPLAGQLVDRFGARRVAVPSILAYGLVLVLMAFLGPSRTEFYSSYAALAVLGAGAQSLTFIRVICAWFDRSRGFVIGICMAGFGLGYVAMPLLTQQLISEGGWRLAYAGLGVLTLIVPLSATACLLRDPPEGSAPSRRKAAERPEASADTRSPGKTLTQALLGRELWLLGLAFTLTSFALYGVQSQFAPLLIDRGIPASVIAMMLAAVGFGSFPGRLLVGLTIDRIFAPYVAIGCYALATAGVVALTTGSSDSVIFVCAVLIGVGLGAENDILGYLAGRYFGLLAFGRIYGILLSAYLLGASIGAYLNAEIRAVSGAYVTSLWVDAASVSASCVLLMFLPRYRIAEASS